MQSSRYHVILLFLLRLFITAPWLRTHCYTDRVGGFNGTTSETEQCQCQDFWRRDPTVCSQGAASSVRLPAIDQWVWTSIVWSAYSRIDSVDIVVRCDNF
jgi:hypothetical protein